MTSTLKCETDKKITQDVTRGKITLVFKEHFPRVRGCIALQKGKRESKNCLLSGVYCPRNCHAPQLSKTLHLQVMETRCKVDTGGAGWPLVLPNPHLPRRKCLAGIGVAMSPSRDCILQQLGFAFCWCSNSSKSRDGTLYPAAGGCAPVDVP